MMGRAAPSVVLACAALGVASAFVGPAPAARGIAVAGSGDAYLGIDLSTQSCTAVVVDSALDVLHRSSVNFDAAFPWYGTENGMHATDGGVVTSPVAMWLDGLDAVLGEIPRSLLQAVDGVSFSGQQHGSVYWTGAAPGLLATGAGGASAATPAAAGSGPPGFAGGFREALFPGAFAVRDSPIWADASTAAQCAALEAAMGGAGAVAAATGSRAYARFTGHQMAAVAARDGAAWAATDRVSLVSSFVPSVFCGAIAPVDASDATGTNVGDVATRRWHPAAVDAFGAMAGVGGARAFGDRLGPAPVPSRTRVGTVAGWVARRFGFRGSGATADKAPPAVYAGAGDNPCTAAGLGLSAPGDVALSLGTSDTFMAVSAAARPRAEGHVFASCTADDEYYALLCYCNGAKQREKVRDDFLGQRASWDAFGDAVKAAPPGNGGVLGLELVLPEITPVIAGTGRFHVDGAGRRVNLGDGGADPAATAARAVVEGKFLSMRGRGANLGVATTNGRVLAAGGAARSKAIMQVAADVFGADVYAADEPDAAALGAAYRAAHAAAPAAPYDAFLASHGAGASQLDVVARPQHAHVYDDALVDRYLAFEDAAAAGTL